jgi:hypothetical protein
MPQFRIAGFAALLGASVALCALPATAQNLSSVSNPRITEGYRAVQVRFAATHSEDDREDRSAIRMNYDHALDSRTQVRGQIIADDRGRDGMELTSFQVAIQRELTPDDAPKWSSAVRVDARLGMGGAPEQAAAAWQNEYRFAQGWRSRFVLQAAVQSGDQASDGVLLQTRWNIARTFKNGAYAGVDIFNTLGSTAALGSFETQSHAIGPTVGFRVNRRLLVNAGVLFGLTDPAADADFRLWFVQTLG